MVSKMSENQLKNWIFPCEYEGNKGRFRFCHPDTKKKFKTKNYLTKKDLVKSFPP